MLKILLSPITTVSTACESRQPVRGKTVLTEISTNSRPIGLIFGTQPPWLHLGGDGYNGYDYDGICYDRSELMAVSATNTGLFVTIGLNFRIHPTTLCVLHSKLVMQHEPFFCHI